VQADQHRPPGRIGPIVERGLVPAEDSDGNERDQQHQAEGVDVRFDACVGREAHEPLSIR
jgi:hypothetical protein